MTYGKRISKQGEVRIPLRADFVFYQIGKFIWLPFCIAGWWFAQKGYQMLEGMTTCAIKRISHLPCPGCGGTRAVYYLFLGQFGNSLYMHPAVIFGVLAYVHFMALYFYRKHISKCIIEREIAIPHYLYTAIGVILIQWLIKIIIIFHH